MLKKTKLPMKPDDLTLAHCEQVLGESAYDWEGRCYEIACAIVAAKLVRGVAVYGHWLGPVDKKSSFWRGGSLPFVQHGWIILHDDERILDPTRWAFEARKPYLFLGLPTKPDGRLCYDEGGNSWRSAMREPPPEFDPDDKMFNVTASVMDGATWRFVEEYLRLDASEQEPGIVTGHQLLWLANSPLGELGEYAVSVYGALKMLKLTAFIPIDNARRVEEGRWDPKRRAGGGGRRS